jgi:hypothetical protein
VGPLLFWRGLVESLLEWAFSLTSKIIWRVDYMSVWRVRLGEAVGDVLSYYCTMYNILCYTRFIYFCYRESALVIRTPSILKKTQFLMFEFCQKKKTSTILCTLST